MGVGAPDPHPAEHVVLELLEHHDPARKTDLGQNPGAAVAGSRLVLAGGDVRRLLGWAITETGGVAVASVRLRDSQDASGEVIARINLAAGGSNIALAGLPGVKISTGRIFLEVIAGSVEGVLYWH